MGAPTVDPVEDNPFRRPKPAATANVSMAPVGASVPAASPFPAASSGEVPPGLQVPQYGCSRLDEANATAQRSVEMGAGILTTLEGQRQQLVGAGNTMAETRRALNDAGTLVSQMMRRAFTNKMVLRIIALLLAASIVVIVLAKWAPRHHNDRH